MADAWGAYREALRARLRVSLTDAVVFAARPFAKGTRDTYLCAVRNILMGNTNDTDLQLAIDGRLLLLGHRKNSGSVARYTVSG